MNKTNKDIIRVIIENPPTKEQSEKRIKELIKHLEQIWKNPKNIN